MTYEIDIEHQSGKHYVQSDGGDIVVIEDNGDGTARVVVYASNHSGGDVAWEGTVRIDFEEVGTPDADALDELADNEDDEVEYHRLRGEAARMRNTPA